MSDTLILNANYKPLCYLPLSTISWQRAIKLAFMDRVQVLEVYENWAVHSPSTTIQVPALAVTREYMKYNKTVRFSRKNLYLRDLYQCQYCSETFENDQLTIDHVIPLSRGGKTTWENCVTACSECNSRKGNLHILPRRLPFKPEYWHLIGNMGDQFNFQIRHDSWRPYLSF